MRYNVAMAKTPMLQNVVKVLDREKKRLEFELSRVTAALTAFGRVYRDGVTRKAAPVKTKRIMSAAARARIAKAQRARWAKVRAAAGAAKKSK